MVRWHAVWRRGEVWRRCGGEVWRRGGGCRRADGARCERTCECSCRAWPPASAWSCRAGASSHARPSDRRPAERASCSDPAGQGQGQGLSLRARHAPCWRAAAWLGTRAAHAAARLAQQSPPPIHPSFDRLQCCCGPTSLVTGVDRLVHDGLGWTVVSVRLGRRCRGRRCGGSRRRSHRWPLRDGEPRRAGS